jgi:hypothetical protein
MQWIHGTSCYYATRLWINKDKKWPIHGRSKEPDFEQVPNQEPSPIQETFFPIE